MITKLTKLLALALAFVMVLGLFAACAKTETPAQTPAETADACGRRERTRHHPFLAGRQRHGRRLHNYAAPAGSV